MYKREVCILYALPCIILIIDEAPDFEKEQLSWNSLDFALNSSVDSCGAIEGVYNQLSLSFPAADLRRSDESCLIFLSYDFSCSSLDTVS